MSTTPIPVWLITGFLGSGKTTLMQRIIAENRDRRLAYLVNEFSAVDVDARLLTDAGGRDVMGIPGGSIFCRCLVTEFIGALRHLLTLDPPLEGVVIEASGMADPRAMGRMLSETGLDAEYRLASITSIVDPASFLKLRATLPNITSQIEAADTILLNKTDLCDATTAAAIEQALREIKPSARIIRCSRTITGFPALQDGTVTLDSQAEYAKCHDPHYRTETVTVDTPQDAEALKTAIQAAADHIYRLKGYVPAADGALFVDHTRANTHISPCAPHDTYALVFILPGGSESTPADHLIQSLRS